MKSTERHKLKENDFVRTVAVARDAIAARKRDITIAIVAVIVAVVAIGGYVWWRQANRSHANELLAQALAVYDSPVVPIAAPAPGSPAPLPQPGTFTTEQEKLQAALPKFTEAAAEYPKTRAGIVARFHEASILAALGKYAEAEKQYQTVIDQGSGTIYASTARLGLADAQVAQKKYDDAINIYTELSRDPNSPIPVDSVLMQLGRAYEGAGRKEEAARTFDRIVQEFPQSVYLTDAQQALETARKS
jgi:TolA-binding protein